MSNESQPSATDCTVDDVLNQHRRDVIIAGLLASKTRADIAKDLGVSRWTVSRWIDRDEQLLEELRKQGRAIYEDTLEELRGIAFSNVEASASTKFQALKMIKEEYETYLRDMTQNLTIEDARRIMSKMLTALESFPEAKEAVIHAFETARRGHPSANGGPDSLPEAGADESPHGA